MYSISTVSLSQARTNLLEQSFIEVVVVSELEILPSGACIT